MLSSVLDPGRLPTPPAIALQVVNTASRPDCDPNEIVSLLSQDPALCAKLLKAVNSCLYGLSRPVSSVSRAVAILGLNTVRSLALGLSLPAMRTGSGTDTAMRDYWVAAVAGGIFARELAVRSRRPAPEDDLIAGLLQDLGSILLRRTFPREWAACLKEHGQRLLSEPCAVEDEVFGINHAEISAQLLRSWKLPDDVVEPIRHHHQPHRLADGPRVMAQRAELLHFVGNLTQLDLIAQYPHLLEQLLATAKARFGMSRSQLVKFLEEVAPKVVAFTGLIDQDVGQRPDFAAILCSGTEELVKLTVENSRDRLSGSVPGSGTHRTLPASSSTPLGATRSSSGTSPSLLEFRPEFLDQLPYAGCRLGELELRQQLGRGAMGVVFKAFEPALERYVAVKMLTPALSACETARARFIREARVAAAIQHENVVAIYAVRETAGVTYLAMEYVRGVCLESYVEQHGPLQIPMLTSVTRQIAAGLAAAHAKQIIHRDIKPANVLLENETGRVKITDFGLARVSDDRNLTTVGTLIGTPYYMAPEIIDGEPASAASDLFSLGGLLYALGTGRPPFEGPNIATVFRAVSQKAPTPPRQLRPELPTWFEKVVLRLLEKEPRHRFASAQEVAALASEYSAD